jgi:hypothetical protein
MTQNLTREASLLCHRGDPRRNAKVLASVADILSMNIDLLKDCPPPTLELVSLSRAKDAQRKALGLPSWEEDMIAFGEWIDAGAPRDARIDAIMGRLERGD